MASGFVTEGAPGLTGGRCVHIATAHFGQISTARAGVFVQLELAVESGPLVPPSPTGFHRAREPASPVRPRPLPPPPNVMNDGFPGPRHLPSPVEPSSGPFPAPHRFLRWDPDGAFHRGPVHDRVFASQWFCHWRLGPVRAPSRNRDALLEPGVACRLLLPTRNPGTPRTRAPHTIGRFRVLSSSTTANRADCERCDT